MVGEGGKALFGEPFCGFFDLVAREAIDDAGMGLVFFEEVEELVARFRFGLDVIIDVGAVEAVEEDAAFAEIEAGDDFVAGGDIRRRGERHARDGGELFVQAGELQIFGAEVVAPLGDAMGFVDSEERDFALGEEREGAVGEEAFGGDVEDVDFAIHCLFAEIAGFGFVERGVEGSGADAELAQGFDLVAHEGDERGDDDAHAFAAQSGDLVAEGFSAAGGHQDQRVAAAHGVGYYLFLLAAEAGEAEGAVQDIGRIGG